MSEVDQLDRLSLGELQKLHQQARALIVYRREKRKNASALKRHLTEVEERCMRRALRRSVKIVKRGRPAQRP